MIRTGVITTEKQLCVSVTFIFTLQEFFNFISNHISPRFLLNPLHIANIWVYPYGEYRNVMTTVQLLYRQVLLADLTNLRDTRNEEYTFACGGRKVRETDVESGNRELNEESNNLFYKVMNENRRPDRIIFSTRRSKSERLKDHNEKIIVTMRYCIFYVEVQNEDYKYLFHNSSFKNDETDDCIVVSKSEIFDLGLRFTFSGVEPRPPPSAP
jgi:hypothetical protein